MLLLGELRDAWRRAPRDHRVALGVMLGVALALRLMHLAQPMRYDEAVTYLYFVKRPWAEAISSYTYPNNHVFHTVLAKVSVGLFGNSPAALRLPALIAGVLVVTATYAAALALYGDRAALLAMAIVASSGLMVLYSTNARGYSLVVLAFLLLILVAIRLLREPTRANWTWFVVIGALGCWTIPVMLYPLGAVSAWMALALLLERRGDEIRQLLRALAATAALTLVLYTPIISRSGLAAITRNRFVVSTGFYEFFRDFTASFREMLASWTLGVPPAISLALAVCALAALRRHALVSRYRASLPLAAYVWCAWLLVVSHRAPFPRVWQWLFPIAAALAGAGALRLGDRWPRSRRFVHERTATLAVAFCAAAATSVVLTRDVRESRDTGTFTDASAAADFLGGVLRSGDRVIAAIPTNGPLAYQLDRRGVSQSVLSLTEDRAQRVFVVVDGGEQQTLSSVVDRSLIADSARFETGRIVARLPRSYIVLFPRRDAPNP